MLRTWRAAVLLILALLLPACTTLQSYWQHHFNVNGAIPTVNNAGDSFSKVDLVAVLTQGGPLPVICSTDNTSQACLAAAFATFYTVNRPEDNVNGQNDLDAGGVDVPAGSTEACLNYADHHLRNIEKARNRIQDQLIAASELACSDFEQELNTFQSNSNFLLGVLSIASGGAGAIVTTANAARALAGSAAAVSGIRAEWNTDLFAKLLVSTLTKAINIKRDDWLVTLRGSCVSDSGEEGSASTTVATPTIVATPSASATPEQGAGSSTHLTAHHTKTSPPSVDKSASAGPATFKIGRQQLPIGVYSVQAAVGDALVYNDLCSLDRGLEFVNASVDTAANPGLDAMKAYLDKLKGVNQSLQAASQANSQSPATNQASPSATPTPAKKTNGAAGHKPSASKTPTG